MPIILHAKNVGIFGGGSASIARAFGEKLTSVVGTFDAVYGGDFWVHSWCGF